MPTRFITLHGFSASSIEAHVSQQSSPPPFLFSLFALQRHIRFYGSRLDGYAVHFLVRGCLFLDYSSLCIGIRTWFLCSFLISAPSIASLSSLFRIFIWAARWASTLSRLIIYYAFRYGKILPSFHTGHILILHAPGVIYIYDAVPTSISLLRGSWTLISWWVRRSSGRHTSARRLSPDLCYILIVLGIYSGHYRLLHCSLDFSASWFHFIFHCCSFSRQAEGAAFRAGHIRPDRAANFTASAIRSAFSDIASFQACSSQQLSAFSMMNTYHALFTFSFVLWRSEGRSAEIFRPHMGGFDAFIRAAVSLTCQCSGCTAALRLPPMVATPRPSLTARLISWWFRPGRMSHAGQSRQG